MFASFPRVRCLAIALAAGLIIPTSASAQFVEADVQVIRAIHGENPNDNLGNQVCAIADYDGDGAMEFLVSVQGDDTRAANAGVVHLYSGTGELLRSHFGLRPNEGRGYVCDAGDVDNDGIIDYLFGTSDGYVYVHSGADGSQLHELIGLSGEQFGFRACGIGDINGDDHGDILVGAWANSSLGPTRGRAYVYSGADGSLLRTHNGVINNGQFGHTVSMLGDLNNDGTPDYSVGAPGPWSAAHRGAIHVFSGASGDPLYGQFDAHQSGIALGGWQQCHGGYHFNGDGVPDYTACDIGDTQNGSSAGKLYLLDGRTGTEIRSFGGFSALSGFGGAPWTSAGGIGDVDGDGISDLLTASWRSQVGATEGGQAHVLSGADGSILRTITSNRPFAYLAGTLSGVGDANGDGVVDYLLAANGDNQNRGAVYIIAGIDYMPSVPGDTNGDNIVNLLDLLDVIAHWGSDGSNGGDANDDGIVNLGDLLSVIAHWGNSAARRR